MSTISLLQEPCFALTGSTNSSTFTNRIVTFVGSWNCRPGCQRAPNEIRLEFAGVYHQRQAGPPDSLTQLPTQDSCSEYSLPPIFSSDIVGRRPPDPTWQHALPQVVLRLVASDSLPPHLLIGSDAVRFAGEAEKTREAEAAQWRQMSLSTDVDSSTALPDMRF
jgi:hypothetical protein